MPLAWTVDPDPGTQTLARAATGRRLYCVRWIGEQFYLFTAYAGERWRYATSDRDVSRVADAADADAAEGLSPTAEAGGQQ